MGPSESVRISSYSTLLADPDSREPYGTEQSGNTVHQSDLVSMGGQLVQNKRLGLYVKPIGRSEFIHDLPNIESIGIVDDVFCELICLTEPDGCVFRLFVNSIHQPDLSALLSLVFLVDAQCIQPDKHVAIGFLQYSENIVCILANGKGKAIDIASEVRILWRSPCIGYSRV